MTEQEALKHLKECVIGQMYLDSEYLYNKAGAIKQAIFALEKQIPKPVLVKDRTCYKDYFCPVCKKQQKVTYKNKREGCYCERCGQKVHWSEEE